MDSLSLELQKNGSPRATFETNDERSFMSVFIPIHEGCGDTVVMNESNGKENVTKDVTKEISERQKIIYQMIMENPYVTIAEMSQKIGVVTRTIIRELAILQDRGILTREGGRKDGRWMIL